LAKDIQEVLERTAAAIFGQLETQLSTAVVVVVAQVHQENR
jgi:membrane carboxypeptidase/penicillin-binding protein PbpC